MSKLSVYDIAFKGLSEGIHQYEYEIDDRFFEKFENSEVERGNIAAKVILTKRSTLLILEMQVKGTVVLTCDRCLEDYRQIIKNNSKLYVKFGETADEESDEIVVIPHEEYQINVAQYLYELIILGIPIKHVHPNTGGVNEDCDPQMIDKLNEYKVGTGEPGKDEDEIDDRWKELKKLLDNK